MELYHRVNEDDHVYAILDKTMTTSNKGELTTALRLKTIGKLNQAVEIFERLGRGSAIDLRIKEFVLGEYL